MLVTKQVSLGRAGIRCLSKRPLARSCNRGNAGRTSTIRVQVGHEAEQIVGKPEMLEHPISLSEPPQPPMYTLPPHPCALASPPFAIASLAAGTSDAQISWTTREGIMACDSPRSRKSQVWEMCGVEEH